MNYGALYSKMFVFAVLLTLGYLLARKGILTKEFNKSASSLLINVFIVASIINSVLGERPELSGKDFALVFGMLCLSEIITYICAVIFCRFLKKDELRFQTELLMEATNTLFVGLPVVSALCGNQGAFYVGMSCIPYNILLYSYGVWNLQRGKGSDGIHLKDLMTSSLIAALLSLVIFIFNPTLPSFVTELFSTTSSATVPVSMIIIGANLGKINPIAAFKEKRNYIVALERLVITPLIAYFIIRLFTDDTALLLSCTVIAAVPVGAIATPLSIQYGYDPEYASRATMVTTILCMLTIPMLVQILF